MRLRNITDVTFEFPSLGLAIPPGGEAEVDLPAEQPCPDGLIEVKSKATAKAPDDAKAQEK